MVTAGVREGELSESDSESIFGDENTCVCALYVAEEAKGVSTRAIEPSFGDWETEAEREFGTDVRGEVDASLGAVRVLLRVESGVGTDGVRRDRMD